MIRFAKQLWSATDSRNQSCPIWNRGRNPKLMELHAFTCMVATLGAKSSICQEFSVGSWSSAMRRPQDCDMRLTFRLLHAPIAQFGERTRLRRGTREGCLARYWTSCREFGHVDDSCIDAGTNVIGRAAPADAAMVRVRVILLKMSCWLSQRRVLVDPPMKNLSRWTFAAPAMRAGPCRAMRESG